MTVLRRFLLIVTVPALLVAAWWAATENSTDFFWPPLSAILGTFRETWFEGRFGADV
ncbi:ABC transporter permease, partial [Micromonospora aurantiaca]|nr:ABC transporter permease [Micromonospora aurantiaca]